jgi:hypothetical protein
MVVYLSKPMIMRINHMWGYQGWENIEWWTCARAKENTTMRHRRRPCCRIAHGWKKSESFVSQQRDILPYTFLLLDSSLSYLSFHSSSLFLFFFFFSITLFHSLIHTYTFSLLFYFSFFLSFPYTYFSLYFPSLDIFTSLFKAHNSSLSCMHNLNFKIEQC